MGRGGGVDKGLALSELETLLFAPVPLLQVCLLTSTSTASPLLDATLLAYEIAGTPVQGWGYLRLETSRKTKHYFSLKGSRRNSDVPPRRSGRRTGSLCIVGHTLAKPPRSVLTLWRETLHLQASHGTAGVCGWFHARTGWAEMTLSGPHAARTLHRAASKPSLLIPPPMTSDAQSLGRHSWWSLGPLKDHRAEPESINTALWIVCLFPSSLNSFLYIILISFYPSVVQLRPLIFKCKCRLSWQTWK